MFFGDVNFVEGLFYDKKNLKKGSSHLSWCRSPHGLPYFEPPAGLEPASCTTIKDWIAILQLRHTAAADCSAIYICCPATSALRGIVRGSVLLVNTPCISPIPLPERVCKSAMSMFLFVRLLRQSAYRKNFTERGFRRGQAVLCLRLIANKAFSLASSVRSSVTE